MTALTMLCSCPAFAGAPATQPSDADDIAAIRARIEKLEVQQKQEEQAHQAAAQQAEVAKTSADLASETQQQDHFLMAEGFTAGYSDGRFVIQSADKNFVFRPWLHLQFREVVLDRKDLIVDNAKQHKFSDEVDDGFEVRQLRFGVDGNMFSPDVTYFINWGTARTSGAATAKSSTGATVGTVSNSLGGVPQLQQAWVKYHIPSTPFAIKAGELKDPLLHEQMVDTRYQQGTERSLSGDIFANGDAFTEAVTFIYDPQTDFRTETGVNHGMRGANTNFEDYPNNGSYNAFDYGFVGRAEYKFFGRWSDYTQVGAVGTKAPLLVAGVGADYSERGRDGQTVAVADIMYADQTGLNFYGSFIDRYTTHNFGIYTQSPTGATIGGVASGKPTNEYSVLLEAGYIFEHHLEPFGRYEFIHLAGDATGSHNSIQAITGGVNYYFYGHRLKLTGEVIWLPEGLPIDDSPNDVLTNSNGKTELSFIAQLQLLL